MWTFLASRILEIPVKGATTMRVLKMIIRTTACVVALCAALAARASVSRFCDIPLEMQDQETDVATVTFDAAGGTLSEAMNQMHVAIGGELGETGLPTPVRDGYAFAGWWTKKVGGAKISARTKVAKDVTYYAHWTARKYKVTAVVNTKAGGTVSGAGTKTYGSRVALKATPKRGYVFVKWINVNDVETPWPNEHKCRQPSVSLTMGAGTVSVKAVFAKVTLDKTPVLTVDSDAVWYVEDVPDREIAISAESLSYPTVAIGGNPAGLGLVREAGSDARYVLKVVDLSKMKPGVYNAKITAKNRAGKTVAKSIRIIAPNSSGAVNAGLISGIESSTLNPYMFKGGMKTKKTLADLGVEVFQTNGWKLASVTGLPTGLSWNGTAIVGAAVKTGVFTATFTMKKTIKNSKTKKTKTYTSTATATFMVDALLPADVVGTYNGFSNTYFSVPEYDGDLEDDGDVEDDGECDEGNEDAEYVVYTPLVNGWASAVKVTVTAAGRITAKIGGVALKGSGFDSVSNGVYAVTLKKTQKMTKGSLRGRSKVWQMHLDIDTNAAWDQRQVAGWCQAYITGLPSMTTPMWISCQRNAFGMNADAKAVAGAVAGFGANGVAKFTPHSAKGKGWSYDIVRGGKALTVTAKANGVLTLAGKIGSTKVSGTGTLELSEAEMVEMVPNDQQSIDHTASLMCVDVCDDPLLMTRRTATARFFSDKFIIEVSYVLEDGVVVTASGRVWRKQ